jgi:hypothetical protein
MTYLKRMQSVLDSCNGQNIYEKISDLLLKIDKIKSQLSIYL